MNVLMISLDRKVFEEGSAARERLAGYGSIFTELHVIVYAKESLILATQNIAPNVWIYPTNSTSRLRYIRDAIRLASGIAQRTHIDVVSAQDASDTGIAANRVATSLHVPLHLQDHADMFNPAFLRERFSNRFRALVARRLLPKARIVRTVSKVSEARLLKEVPSITGRTFLLPVYTEIAALHDAVPSFSLHERYPQFKTILFNACRFVPQKNLPLALATLALLRKSNPSIGLVIVGEGPDKDALMLEANRLGVGDAVVFEPWQQDLASFYKGAEVFLMTSNYESYGRTLVEAAASGLPIVSTDVGIARELAAAGAGIVAESTPENLANAITQALKTKQSSDKSRADVGYAAAQCLQGASYQAYLERYKAMMERCLEP